MRRLGLAVGFALSVGGVWAATPRDVMLAFARSAVATEVWHPTTCGEPLAAYGSGDSTPKAVRAAIAAAVVFETLGRSDVPDRATWAQLGESAFRYLWFSHAAGEFDCADGRKWSALGRWGFTEPIHGLKDVRAVAAQRTADGFFPSVPLVEASPVGRYERCAAAAERAYAASCAVRGVPYVPVGGDVRDGGRLGLGRALLRTAGEVRAGDFVLDARIAEGAPRGSDEGVNDVLRRQLRVRPLSDGRTAVVRERVTAVKSGELPRGFAAVPYRPDCVRLLAGEAKATTGEVAFADGEILYDVTYAVNADGDANALARVRPVALRLPVLTQPDDETDAWQARIDAASAAGGGRVTIPAGDHVVAELELKDNVTLELAAGARLVAVTNDAAYRWTVGVKAELQRTGVVVAYGATNVALVGAGTIDGRGDAQPRSYSRPVKWRSVYFERCRDVRLDGVTLVNPSFWSCFLRECARVHVKGLRIRGHSNYNNDGLDLCVSDALVEGCDIDTDDDAVVFKNFSADWESRNVEVRDCRISSNATAVKFGTETFGPMRGYRIHNLEILPRSRSRTRERDVADPAWPGLRDVPNGLAGFEFLVVDGGVLEDVHVHDVTLRGVRVPFCVLQGRRNGRENWGRSHIRGLTLERVRMTAPAETGIGCFIKGLEGAPVRDVTIRDCDFLMQACPEAAARIGRDFPENAALYPWCGHFEGPVPAHFLYVRRGENVRLDNVRVTVCGTGELREAIVADGASRPVAVTNCSFGTGATTRRCN